MRVLIADRHDLFRQSVAVTLQEIYSSSITLREAGSLLDFGNLLKQERFNLIIAGSNILQGLDLRALRKIRYGHEETPILAMMECQNTKLTESLQRLRINDIIPKSSPKATFRKVTTALLEGARHITPIISSAQNHMKAEEAAGPQALTKRQDEVWLLMAEGQSNRDIAGTLKLSEGTVKVHVTAVLKTLGVKNRTQAMLLAQRIHRKKI